MRQPGPDPSSKLRSAATGSFNTWLQRRLEASRLTQRQLSGKAGVHHSTISRLVRGHRTPSLHTVTSLAHALGVTDSAGLPSEVRPGSSSSRPAEVEYALRSDDALTEKPVRQIMEYYLTARRARTPNLSSAAKHSGRRTPVPIVVQVLERRDTGFGRQADRPRRGAG